MLQGLDGLVGLLHVQVDDAYLLVGHRPAQLVVALLGIAEHPLRLLQGPLQLGGGAEGIGLQLPGAVIIVPQVMLAEPGHLDVGLFSLLLGKGVILQGDHLLPAGIPLLHDIAMLLLFGYLCINPRKGSPGGILVIRLTGIENHAPRQKA